MTKLPEPYSTVGSLLGEIGTFAAMGYNLRRGDGLYTEDQMLQFRRDALEEAAKCCEWLANAVSNSNDVAIQNRHLCATEIRKLKDET